VKRLLVLRVDVALMAVIAMTLVWVFQPTGVAFLASLTAGMGYMVAQVLIGGMTSRAEDQRYLDAYEDDLDDYDDLVAYLDTTAPESPERQQAIEALVEHRAASRGKQ